MLNSSFIDPWLNYSRYASVFAITQSGKEKASLANGSV
jgi:hypothetical protein